MEHQIGPPRQPPRPDRPERSEDRLAGLDARGIFGNSSVNSRPTIYRDEISESDASASRPEATDRPSRSTTYRCATRRTSSRKWLI